MRKLSVLGLGVLMSACLLLTGCSSTTTSSSAEVTEEASEEVVEETTTAAPETEAETTEEAGEVLSAPTDFEYDPMTGEFSFTATDENAGYYFVRVYSVIDGEETGAYVSSSSRVNGGSTGTKTGTVDVSAIGWGEYHIKLVTFAAAGSGYTAPDAVVLTANYGFGGTLERPEFAVITDGSTVEFVVDWYSLSNYYAYQYLPEVEFCVYADEDCTELVTSVSVDLIALLDVMDTHPTGAYIWAYTMSDTLLFWQDSYGVQEGYGMVLTSLEAGTYYVTCQAISNNEEAYSSSLVNGAIEITVSGEADSAYDEIYTSELWVDPSVMGMPTAQAGAQTDRVDYGQDQDTSAVVS